MGVEAENGAECQEGGLQVGTDFGAGWLRARARRIFGDDGIEIQLVVSSR